MFKRFLISYQQSRKVNYLNLLLKKKQITTMDETIDYRTHYFRLKNENQYLKLELQEFHSRQKNLKKQLQIISQVNEQQQKSNNQIQQQMLLNEIQQMKQQLLILYKQRQQKQQIIRNHLEKINDLKYNNGELKNLNEKITQVYNKEIQMLKKQRGYGQNYQEKQRKLQKQIQNLNSKLQSCADITKQMQSYYMSEIRQFKDVINTQENTIQSLMKDLEQVKTHRSTQFTPKIIDSIKQNNQKWERTLAQVKEQYQIQIKQSKSKIKFLVNKLQSMQESESKPSLGNLTNETLIQSKMIQSNSSIDSFRFTPNSSVSSNKECIQPQTRRNPSNFKQTNQKGKIYVPLGQKNHY